MSVLTGTQEGLEIKNEVEASPEVLSLNDKLSTNVIWAKLTRWEFWPFSFFYFPIAFYWAWLCLRTRSFFFFTAANPSIEFGGMLGESKDKIYKIIPEKYIPKTYKLESTINKFDFLVKLESESIQFPFILKPDIGERGWMVELINNEQQLDTYLKQIEVDFLVQEYIPYATELGIFFYKYPDRINGTISSIVMKDMLHVKGDGKSTVRTLVENDVRAKMQLEKMEAAENDLLEYVPLFNETVELEPIGNHSRGTTFLNGNHLINKKLVDVFNEVSGQIEGFYFGRYDIRCSSIEDLYQGKNFKILELNGAGSEPAHIYQPGFPLIQAYKDIIHHLKVLTDISKINKRRGVPYYTFLQGMKEVWKIRRYNRAKKQTA